MAFTVSLYISAVVTSMKKLRIKRGKELISGQVRLWVYLLNWHNCGISIYLDVKTDW